MDKPSFPSSSCRLLPLKSTFSSLYLLTSFFGHKNCFHRQKYSLGLGLWITNIVIHFTMDFYEAYAIFGVAWATAIGMYLITFVTASACLAKTTLPWLENSLMLLHEAGGYPETLRIMTIVLKIAPVLVVCLGCAGGAGQYTCYYVDGATRLDFNNALPHWLAVVLNVLRFTSLLHMFCGYSLFLVIPVCVMIVSQLSMKEFKGLMDGELKRTNTSMTFGTAVTLFEERASFIRQSSKSCSMMLIILVVSSTLSFTLNVYNFLFVRRLAIYFWFAVLPLLWIAIPLAVAAWATDTYHTFAGVVLKNWAQTSGDALASRPSARGVVTSDVTPEINCVTCRTSASQLLQCKNNTGAQYARRKFRKSWRNVIRPLQVNPCPAQIGMSNPAFHTGLKRGNGFMVHHGLNRDTSNSTTIAEPAVVRESTVQRTLGEQVNISSRFDFERYIIYLQCLLPDVGFSVAGCLVTWEKVFGLAVFMTSLAAVFIQEVMFGSRKNTIGRP